MKMVLTALWAIVLAAAFLGAVFLFLLLSLAWTHKPVSVVEFLKEAIDSIADWIVEKFL